MAVQAEIRAVPRPVNTLVVDNGKNGVHRWAVRSRRGVKYIRDGNPQPISGPVIGHICDGQFVLLGPALSPAALPYGACALIHSLSTDLFQYISKIYELKAATTIIYIASLRVIKPGISSRRLAQEYRDSYISLFYPGLALSENTVCKFFELLGRDSQKRTAFYDLRMASVPASHHIIIDGTLKQDTGCVNDQSALSYKARIKGCKDVSLVYAYDLEMQEPLCAEVFTGNCLDAYSYEAFINDNHVTKGIITCDKGFPPSQIQAELEANSKLYFLSILKRNDVRIKQNQMLDFTGVLKGFAHGIFYKQCRIDEKQFLYALRDIGKAMKEEICFADNAKKRGDFSDENFQKKKDSFGSVVFLSDLDLSPEKVYAASADRWFIELMFSTYKNNEELDQTTVKRDFSVWGSEFINFIATVLTCRAVKAARRAGLLNDESWGDLLGVLRQVWRLTKASPNPTSNDKSWAHTLPHGLRIMEELGLSEPAPIPEHRKVGRTRIKPEFIGPKRPRGRPRQTL